MLSSLLDGGIVAGCNATEGATVTTGNDKGTISGGNAEGIVAGCNVIDWLVHYSKCLLHCVGRSVVTSEDLDDWWYLTPFAVDILTRSLPAQEMCNYLHHKEQWITMRRHLQRYDPPDDLRSMFFQSLSLYTPLWFSPNLTLRNSNSVKSHLSYGVFAVKELGQHSLFEELQGKLVFIDDRLYDLLPEASRFSIVELPSDSSTTTTSSVDNQRHVLVGGMSFLNDACEAHSNVWPADMTGALEGEPGTRQWQTVYTKRSIPADTELFVSYSTEAMDSYECAMCRPKKRRLQRARESLQCKRATLRMNQFLATCTFGTIEKQL